MSRERAAAWSRHWSRFLPGEDWSGHEADRARLWQRQLHIFGMPFYYIDYALAWGPNILGYRHPKVVEAVARAAAGPHIYGCQHELEIQVAEKIQSLVPCAERVATSWSCTVFPTRSAAGGP